MGKIKTDKEMGEKMAACDKRNNRLSNVKRGQTYRIVGESKVKKQEKEKKDKHTGW